MPVMVLHEFAIRVIKTHGSAAYVRGRLLVRKTCLNNSPFRTSHIHSEGINPNIYDTWFFWVPLTLIVDLIMGITDHIR